MNKHKILIILLFLFLVFLIIFSVIFSILNMGNENIYFGISVNKLDLSNMSKDEANTYISESIKNKVEEKITLQYNDYSYDFYFSSLNIHYDIDTALSKAYNYGKSGNIIHNNYRILKASIFKKNFNINVDFDDDSFLSTVADISSELPGRLVQPDYYIEDKNLIITRGSSGVVIDEEKLKDLLISHLNNLSSENNTFSLPVIEKQCEDIDLEKIHSEVFKEVKDAYYEKDPFKIYPEVVGVTFDYEKVNSLISEHPDDKEYTIQLSYTEPKITLDNLNIDIFPDLLASFSTRFDASNTKRSTNLQLASDKINGTVLSPNSTFSYNKVVGERSIAAGYKEAKVYSNGQVVDGIGGGICQVSSTLYNAAIFANLDITERYNHQFVCSYVPAGRDATVVYGAKDLKFKNNRSYPIKIFITINTGIIKAEIYGIREDIEYDVSFDTETVSEIRYKEKYQQNYSLPAGEEKIKQAGSFGRIVNVYKVLKKSGIVISKELISKDSYRAMDRIILTKTGRAIKKD